MLGSWFAAKARKEGDTEDSTSVSPSVRRRLSVSHRDGEDTSRVTPAVLSNPHDSILADLTTRGRDPTPSVKSSAGVQQGSPVQHGQQEQDPSSVSPALTVPIPVPETIYDPFTGAALGTIHAPESTVLEDPEATRDQLWSHLSQIRELQSDIAAMHVAMEKIGQPDGKRNRKGKAERIATAASRLRERESVWDTEGEGETEPELDTDKEKKKAKDEEFDRLADRFTGRKEAINEIMNKLDKLSQAVTEFHALREPSIDFSASHTNTATTDPTPTTSPVAHSATGAASPPSVPVDLTEDIFSTSKPPTRSDDCPSNAAPSSHTDMSSQLGIETKPAKLPLPILLTQLGDDHPV
ncbi:hypothetical protein NEOLEDRAFT_1174260 [Neolentinus lepideus HHB14362 ss-1]|uniref:Uncharacterized protein n=1 Tax=Neolentinus lepideus HHB14362 ss-1 TaxID=1314782 RepID=A0A165WA94_9AGAM|nr:hypothetical protein NEOLEDRAFT_1174260 [Neolentinus lepideus HHB14362 ss-1]